MLYHLLKELASLSLPLSSSSEQSRSQGMSYISKVTPVGMSQMGAEFPWTRLLRQSGIPRQCQLTLQQMKWNPW